MAAAAEVVPYDLGTIIGMAPSQRKEVLNETDSLNAKITLHRRLPERVNLEAISSMAGERARAELRSAIRNLVEEEFDTLASSEKERLVEEVFQETFGLGPLEPLLQDPTISDILVTTPKMVHVERSGRLYESAVEFKDDAHLIRVIEKIVSRVGRRIDETSPLVDARLPDGSRVNAVIPPVAVDGPLLSIRRFGHDRLKAEKLVQNLTLTQGMLDCLEACVKARLNILVSGGTGAGKTTLLNVLSSYISESERVVTIEDAAELQLRQRHVARMESRPSNIGGAGAVRIRDLVINALRMRPDRIIVGEVRGEEALDMLQAMNTGHDGSLTTIHANTPREATSRLEVLVGMANAQYAGARRAPADELRDPRRGADIQAQRRLPPRDAHHRVLRHGRRPVDHAGPLRLREDGTCRGRQGERPLQAERHPAEVP